MIKEFQLSNKHTVPNIYSIRLTNVWLSARLYTPGPQDRIPCLQDLLSTRNWKLRQFHLLPSRLLDGGTRWCYGSSQSSLYTFSGATENGTAAFCPSDEPQQLMAFHDIWFFRWVYTKTLQQVQFFSESIKWLSEGPGFKYRLASRSSFLTELLCDSLLSLQGNVRVPRLSYGSFLPVPSSSLLSNHASIRRYTVNRQTVKLDRSRMKQQDVGENRVTRSSTTRSPRQLYNQNDKLKEAEMNWTRSTHMREQECIQGFGGKTRKTETTSGRRRRSENNIKIVLFLLLGGVRQLSDLLYQPRLIGDYERGSVARMRIGRGKPRTLRKLTPLPHCRLPIPYGLTWVQNRAAAVGSQRLTA